MPLTKYVVPDGEGDVGELEWVTPIRQPLMWNVPFSERNHEMLQLAAEALLKLESPLGPELMLIVVQSDLAKPRAA